MKNYKPIVYQIVRRFWRLRPLKPGTYPAKIVKEEDKGSHIAVKLRIER
ncbi:MAG: hypothetical protein ACE5HV_00090 [Acidobacteriota bacterium]